MMSGQNANTNNLCLCNQTELFFRVYTVKRFLCRVVVLMHLPPAAACPQRCWCGHWRWSYTSGSKSSSGSASAPHLTAHRQTRAVAGYYTITAKICSTEHKWGISFDLAKDSTLIERRVKALLTIHVTRGGSDTSGARCAGGKAGKVCLCFVLVFFCVL